MPQTHIFLTKSTKLLTSLDQHFKDTFTRANFGAKNATKNALKNACGSDGGFACFGSYSDAKRKSNALVACDFACVLVPKTPPV
jgi:hypothetical protein